MLVPQFGSDPDCDLTGNFANTAKKLNCLSKTIDVCEKHKDKHTGRMEPQQSNLSQPVSIMKPSMQSVPIQANFTIIFQSTS